MSKIYLEKYYNNHITDFNDFDSVIYYVSNLPNIKNL